MSVGDRCVSSCRELAYGDRIEAAVSGVVWFQGEVVQIWPAMELFWAIDSLGERRIIEFSEYTVSLLDRAGL
jgi:hypothetical protein